jgi:cellulose synthase (UDP-forming)
MRSKKAVESGPQHPSASYELLAQRNPVIQVCGTGHFERDRAVATVARPGAAPLRQAVSVPRLREDPADRAREQAAGLAALLSITQNGQIVAAKAAASGGRHRRTVRKAIPARQRVTYMVLLLVGLFLAGRFAYFWFSLQRVPRDFGPRLDVWDLILFAGLSFVIWHRQVMDMITWMICRHMAPHYESPPPTSGLRVAFITTFVPGSEPLAMLRQTLMGMKAAEYPHDTWVLDEGDMPDVRALCRELGVRHFSRHGLKEYNTDRGRFLAKTKAGNHNAWYSRYGDSYDFVAQVDTDYRVSRHFLTATLGYFRDRNIAFVGTPQIYGNTQNFIARGAAEQTYLFYGPIMRALSRRKMSLLIGANHVVRVAALRDIGYYEGHLTEDLATGKRFHARHWESLYIPEPLAIGEGPTTWTSYFNQQYRWAYGCMNIFFTHSPRLNPQMRRRHAFCYFLLEQFYFSGLTMVTAVGLLLLYDVFGWTPANFAVRQLVFWYLPLLAWRQLMPFWLQRFNVRPLEERGLMLAGRLLSIAAIPVYFLAFVGVLRNKRVTWKTTPKGDVSGREEDCLTVFAPHLAASLVLTAGLCAGVILGHTSWVFLAWGTATAILLSAFTLAQLGMRAINAARWRRTPIARASTI